MMILPALADCHVPFPNELADFKSGAWRIYPPLLTPFIATPRVVQVCQSHSVLQYSEALAFIRFLSLRCGSFRRAVISAGKLGWELLGSKACFTLVCMIKTVNKAQKA